VAANRFLALLLLVVPGALVLATVACGVPPADGEVAAQVRPERLVLYDWAEDMPQAILDAFTAETGVPVVYETYDTLQEAVANLRAGRSYDVVILESDEIPTLIAEERLAPLDFRNIPNFKNISPNFRDLAYDPFNTYSVPFNWGTTGLVIRTDLVDEIPMRWADLWSPRYAGRIAVRGEQRELIGVALKSLGYSVNTESPDEIEAARQLLARLMPGLVLVDPYGEAATEMLARGKVSIVIGWAEDVVEAQDAGLDVAYILPAEGTILWGDNFVVPAASTHAATAEAFIDFVLRPENSAAITNQNYYATPNVAARPFIDPKFLDAPVIFPTDDMLRNSTIYLPLSPEVDALYLEAWNSLLGARR